MSTGDTGEMWRGKRAGERGRSKRPLEKRLLAPGIFSNWGVIPRMRCSFKGFSLHFKSPPSLSRSLLSPFESPLGAYLLWYQLNSLIYFNDCVAFFSAMGKAWNSEGERMNRLLAHDIESPCPQVLMLQILTASKLAKPSRKNLAVQMLHGNSSPRGILIRQCFLLFSCSALHLGI